MVACGCSRTFINQSGSFTSRCTQATTLLPKPTPPLTKRAGAARGGPGGGSPWSRTKTKKKEQKGEGTRTSGQSTRFSNESRAKKINYFLAYDVFVPHVLPPPRLPLWLRRAPSIREATCTRVAVPFCPVLPAPRFMALGSWLAPRDVASQPRRVVVVDERVESQVMADFLLVPVASRLHPGLHGAGRLARRALDSL